MYKILFSGQAVSPKESMAGVDSVLQLSVLRVIAPAHAQLSFTSPAQTATITRSSSFDAVVAQLVEQLIRNQ